VPPILDTIDAHPGSRFVIRAAAQLFKTLLGQLRAMRSMLVEPASSLWYAHPDKFIDDFCDEKFNPLFDALPVLHPLLFTDPNKRARNRLQFPAGHNFLLRSARVQLNRQGKTARDIYLDEPWTYEPGWCADISKRRSSFDELGTWREIYMTTGTIAGTEADQIWRASTRHVWHPRCPSCRRLIAPRRTHKDPATGERLGGLVYETLLTADGLPDAGAIAATVAYQCPHCRTRLPDTAATRLAMNGTARAPIGLFLSENPSPSTAPRTFGWHVPSLCAKPWAPLAVQMVAAEVARSRGDLSLLRELILKEDADTWDEEKYHRPETFSRYQHPTPYRLLEPWPAELTDPAGRPLRIATVDVQLDHFVLVIRKWGRFSTSRLHFAAICFSASEVLRHCEEHGVPVERTALDTRHDTQRVRTICARLGWRSMMGDKAERDYAHPDGIRRIYAEPKAIDAFTGTALAERAGSFVVETVFSKNSALSRLHAIRAPEARTPTGEPVWTAASDAPDWYFKQINAHYRKRVDNPDGSHHYVWHGQKDDHADDCEAMQIVIATALGLTGAESMTKDPAA
jgi:hypothetical protein